MPTSSNKPAQDSELDEAMLAVWRQALLEKAKTVRVGEESYGVRRTAKHRLAQVDFEWEGQPFRGLEQNPQTTSRWAQMARRGAKVMQFLSNGRYLAVVADGKITHYSSGRK